MSAGSPAPTDAVAPPSGPHPRGHGFGTAPVFLAAISTILGAIMFLRFGYAVGNTGLAGAITIILLGHLVTVPTALAISEIATNRRVEGGGEYFIVSRSFGTSIGGAIGISLYLSQAISVAFYMIAFAEAFRPLAPWLETSVAVLYRELPFDPRWVSVPGLALLAFLVTKRGAAMGVKALWVVVTVLAVSLVAFFLGDRLPPGLEPGLGPVDSAGKPLPFAPEPFILVFAIVFPAFTGMTAGVGLSGDLANPGRSIPLGTLAATLFGMVVYLAIVWKLHQAAEREQLAYDQMIMARIAVWGPVVPIGLACATLSSAIGSILVAPRTLQALAADRIFPVRRLNWFLSRGAGAGNDPRNATVLTGAVAVGVALIGDVDFVARIISMFFMVTYGALCAISFLEHFAARPSYRPSFRSKWYLSLLGALMCLFLMFQMDPLYALLAVVIMVTLYVGIRATRDRRGDDLAAIFHGVMTQLTRWMQIKLQKTLQGRHHGDWRPSIIMVNERTFDRPGPLDLLRWLCHRYGFATYLHFIQGRLNEENYARSRDDLRRLLAVRGVQESAIYVDTLISPSLTTALAQSMQVPGISGMENNAALFEFRGDDPEEVLAEIRQGCDLALAARMGILVLRHTEHRFGDRRTIHLWLTWHDYDNASMMILMAYILLGHPEWADGVIRIFAAFPEEDVVAQTEKLTGMIASGRIPISRKNIEIIPTDAASDFNALVEERSREADLTILGFTPRRLEGKGTALLRRHPGLRDVLWVSAREAVDIG